MGGSLASVPATQLGITAVKHAIGKAGIAAKEVEEVYMGHVVQAGTGQSPARQVALGAGSVNRFSVRAPKLIQFSPLAAAWKSLPKPLPSTRSVLPV